MHAIPKHALEEELARGRISGRKEHVPPSPTPPPNSVTRQDPGLSPSRWDAEDSSGSEEEWENLISTLEQRASGNMAKSSAAAPVSWDIPPPRRIVPRSGKDAESDHGGQEDSGDDDDGDDGFLEEPLRSEGLREPPVQQPAPPTRPSSASPPTHRRAEDSPMEARGLREEEDVDLSRGQFDAGERNEPLWDEVDDAERSNATSSDGVPVGVRDVDGSEALEEDESLPWVSAFRQGSSLHCHPIGVWRESQPIRTISFEPLGGALAIGSNARSVRIVDTDVDGGPARSDATALPTLPLLQEWRNHHHGSVYCLAWSSAWGGPQRTAYSRANEEEHTWAHEALPWLASGSNDTCIQLVQSAAAGSSSASVAPPPARATTLRTPSSAGGGTVRTVQFLAPHLLVSGGSGDFALRVWDVNRAAADEEDARQQLPVAVWAGHSGVVFAACVLAPRGAPPGGASQRSTVVSAGADGTLRLWDARVAGGEVMRISSQANVAEAPMQRSGPVEIQSLAAWDAASSSDGAGQRPIVAGGLGDGSVRVWDLTSGKSQPVETMHVHGSDVRGLSLAPTGDPVLATASFDGTAAILVERGGEWEVAHRWGKEQKDSFGHSDRLLSVQWHPYQPMLATSSADKSVCLWELEGW